jgi:small glutamine-rich tetratricopeptide repeat-containing protein alpha
MPDLAGLLNNPAMMSMAQQMMQSGAFNDIMQNPEMLSNM